MRSKGIRVIHYPNLLGMMAKRGITQIEMAAVIGMNSATFSLKINKKRKSFTLEQGLIMAKELNCTLDELFLPDGFQLNDR